MSKKKHSQKKPIGYLEVVWVGRPPYPYRVRSEKELRNLERFLKKSQLGSWQFASYKNPKGEPVHYYHPNEGTQRLDKKQYKAQVRPRPQISIYIVPTNRHKRQVGSDKGVVSSVEDLEGLSLIWDPSWMYRILVYAQQSKQPSHEYNGTLKKL